MKLRGCFVDPALMFLRRYISRSSCELTIGFRARRRDYRLL